MKEWSEEWIEHYREMVGSLVRVDRNECWLWTRFLDRDGYGRMHFMGAQRMAHRVSYMVFTGKIADGMTLDHLCRARSCVNPEHLEPVTQRENTMRGNTVARRKSEQTHCIHGHAFDEKNTKWNSAPSRGNPTRQCKKCESDRMKAKRKQET